MRILQKILSEDGVLNRIQDQLIEILNPVLKKELLDGDFVKNISLSTGQDNVISHKLGRPVNGWIVVKTNAVSVVWESPTENSIPDKQIILQTNANATANIYFF